MTYYTHSHCLGDTVVPVVHKKEVIAAIGAINGRTPASIRSSFLPRLQALGWGGELPVAIGSDMTISSSKDSVGLCLQTGNMARAYADLIKLQALYYDGAITCGIIVLPSQLLARDFGSNFVQGKRLIRELEIFRKVYHVPTLLFELE